MTNSSNGRPTIRAEQPSDEAAIGHVHRAAFPTSAECQLVADLRRAGRLMISLVALVDDQIVGHVAFSRVSLTPANSESIAHGLAAATLPADSEQAATIGLGLAPLAVIPAWQRTGVGSALARAGLEQCRLRGAAYVVVLGSPAYYGRFGFSAAANWNLTDDYQGGPAFQAIELVQGLIPPAGGSVRFAPEFAAFAL